MRRVVALAGLGALAGAIDAVVRGESPAAIVAGAGWVAGFVAIVGAVAAAGVVVLARVMPGSDRALVLARARVAVVAIGAWVAVQLVLADRFVARFSDASLIALLWAAVGVGLAAAAVLAGEPIARNLVNARRAERRELPLRVVVAIAIGVAACAIVALVVGVPADVDALGSIAARWLAPN